MPPGPSASTSAATPTAQETSATPSSGRRSRDHVSIRTPSKAALKKRRQRAKKREERRLTQASSGVYRRIHERLDHPRCTLYQIVEEPVGFVTLDEVGLEEEELGQQPEEAPPVEEGPGRVELGG